MTRIIHPISGALAMLTIATFWIATVASEVFGSQAMIVSVKTAIPWGFLLLVPTMVAAGGSGFVLGKGRERATLVAAKARRMPFIGANGLLILMPSALFLASRAAAGTFDTAFYAVQVLELLAGATNMVLLALNMRDGLRMKGRLRRSTTK